MRTQATETFSHIYRHWAPRLFNHFRRLSWTVEDASDLTADVFATALEKLPEVRDRQRIGAWLWTIANRQAANRRRSNLRRQSREMDASEDAARTRANDPHTNYRLRRALEALPAPARQMILWREYSGLTYREIAELSNCTVEAVRSTLYRARVQLRDEYRKRMES